MTHLKTLLLASAATLLAGVAHASPDIDRVLLISIDGLHARDLTRFVANPAHKYRTLTALAARGTVYPSALTTAPSDSFPGMVAQVTGGTPKSAGVYYDDSYDRTLFDPTNTTCAGDPGAEVMFAENLDRDPNRLTPAAGGTLGQPLTQIDPANLPRALRAGQCVPLYPHEFIRVNTIFEVIRAHGGHTAWADKHPAYEILNGPSGTGIEDLFTPEVDSVISGTAPGGKDNTNTNSYTGTRHNDELKVQAVIHEIEGLDSTGKHGRRVPNILGMNFQAVSVGEKLAKSGPLDPAGLTGGYLDAAGNPGTALTGQLDYVDDAIRRMVAALVAQHLDGSTMIIISAKHGQSPIDPARRVALDDGPYNATPGVAFHIADDVALVWLKPQTRFTNVKPARTYLLSQSDTLGINELLTPREIKHIFRDPATDARAPDFVAIVNQGVIYTGGTKLAEHGGFAEDDRNVALLVVTPGGKAKVVSDLVFTTQIAPTILKALDLNPDELEAVQIEHTQPLPGVAY